MPSRAEQFGRRYRRNRPWAVRDLSLALPFVGLAILVADLSIIIGVGR
jgi:hypothetical protein